MAAVFGSVRSAGVGFRYYYLRKRFIAISGRSWDFDFAEYLSEKMAEVKAETVLTDIGPPACCSEQWPVASSAGCRSPCLTSVSILSMCCSFRNDEPFWLYRFSTRWWRSRCSHGV